MIIYIGIEKSQHPDVERIKKSRSLPIVFEGLIAKVGFSIEFDGETFRRAIKINDVITDAVLPTKFVAMKLTVLQSAPELPLRRGCFVSQGLAAGFKV